MRQFATKYIFVLLLFVISFSSKATHTIGGDIQVTWSGRGNIYNIQLNKYVNHLSEELHKLPEETQSYVSVYRTKSNVFLLNRVLTRTNIITSPTSSTACVDLTKVETHLQIFNGQIDMTDWNDPEGYYVVWDYCCRNEVITNIQKPIVNGQVSQQDAFLYTTFPGVSYRNHSPVFKQLGNEYFCANVLNTFDYSATDVDGDHLIYSIISPYQASYYYPTYSYSNGVGAYYGNDFVWAGPAPFRNVDFLSGYSAANPIPGAVGLQIDASTGVLTFNPSQTGIFLFGVKVEEYRAGKKIGEIHRDFQFNVQNCPVNKAPAVGFTNPTINAKDTISITLKADTCIPIYVTDPDALTRIENVYSTINSGAYPVSAIGLTQSIKLTAALDTIVSCIRFKPCLATTVKSTTYYPVSIVVSNHRCPEQYDTLVFTLRVVVPVNAIPTIVIDPPQNPKVVKIDSLLHFKVIGIDRDAQDLLSLKIYGRNRTMSFKNVSDSSSSISSDFAWVPTCEDLNPGTFNVYFIVQDNRCIAGHADTVYQTIKIEDNPVSFDSMRITNLVTPNNDEMNDYYEIPGIPNGNCTHFFKNIEIYNKWGSRVFYSDDKNFRWYPKVADGIYYYSIDLNENKRSGWVEVMGNTNF